MLKIGICLLWAISSTQVFADILIEGEGSRNMPAFKIKAKSLEAIHGDTGKNWTFIDADGSRPNVSAGREGNKLSIYIWSGTREIEISDVTVEETRASFWFDGHAGRFMNGSSRVFVKETQPRPRKTRAKACGTALKKKT